MAYGVLVRTHNNYAGENHLCLQDYCSHLVLGELLEIDVFWLMNRPAIVR